MLMLGIVLLQVCIIIYSLISFFFPNIDIFNKIGTCFSISLLFVISISISNYFFLDNNFPVHIGIISGASIAALKSRNFFSIRVSRSEINVSNLGIVKNLMLFLKIVLYAVIGAIVSYSILLFTFYLLERSLSF
jgi:hypothetical protein